MVLSINRSCGALYHTGPSVECDRGSNNKHIYMKGEEKMKRTKWVELVIPAAIFFVPIVLIAVTFYNTGRL